MARPSQLKISKEQFKRYLIKNYIDQEGRKVSIRDLWNRQSFLSYTGLYNKKSLGYDLKMCSMGTASKWNEILEVREHELYPYYIKKGLIDPSITFEMWSRKCNRGGKPNYANLQKDYKIYFMEHFNLDYIKCREMGLDELKREAMKLYEALDYGIEEFIEDYDVFRNSFDIEDRVLSENRHINQGVDK